MIQRQADYEKQFSALFYDARNRNASFDPVRVEFAKTLPVRSYHCRLFLLMNEYAAAFGISELGKETNPRAAVTYLGLQLRKKLFTSLGFDYQKNPTTAGQ